jgi:hypothetical protein
MLYLKGENNYLDKYIQALDNLEWDNNDFECCYENGENMKLSKTELDNQSYNKIDTISEYSEFEDIYQSLYKCIFARVIGKKNGDENVIVKLNGLKNRILQNIDEQNKEKFNLKFNELYKMANGTTIIGTEISAADNELLK